MSELHVSDDYNNLIKVIEMLNILKNNEYYNDDDDYTLTQYSLATDNDMFLKDDYCYLKKFCV